MKNHNSSKYMRFARKVYLLILTVLLWGMTLPLTAQGGDRMIRKAQQFYQRGQNKRALKLLARAEQLDYGFCGNAWLQADWEIHRLRSLIHLSQGAYTQARAALREVGRGSKEEVVDSMVVQTYQLEFGAEVLKEVIDTALTQAMVECDKEDCYSHIPLPNGMFLSLKVDLLTTLYLLSIEAESERTAVWLSVFKRSKSYQQIKEGRR